MNNDIEKYRKVSTLKNKDTEFEQDIFRIEQEISRIKDEWNGIKQPQIDQLLIGKKTINTNYLNNHFLDANLNRKITNNIVSFIMKNDKINNILLENRINLDDYTLFQISYDIEDEYCVDINNLRFVNITKSIIGTTESVKLLLQPGHVEVEFERLI